MMVRRINEKPMKEIVYRESRVARALGEPSKFAIIDVLLKCGPINLFEIAKRVKRSSSTVCHHLAALKKLEIARYEVKSEGVYYWIKYPKELLDIIRSLEAFVVRTQQRLTTDT